MLVGEGNPNPEPAWTYIGASTRRKRSRGYVDTWIGSIFFKDRNQQKRMMAQWIH